MVEKIKVAVDARSDPNFLVIARTDARQSEGMDGVLRRLEAYAEAGADVVFPEALTSEAEMRLACETFDKPVMANMSNGGLHPGAARRRAGGDRLCLCHLPLAHQPGGGGGDGKRAASASRSRASASPPACSISTSSAR